ncbi:response regulator [Halorubrum tebenquichense]|uniref:histidine kinase n=1 Tax=Halorubrum tebenquichense DSM 14210 TaxID=1227485 RepID=M0DTM3_9EURY|nr:response regulator [Halorubrum tebenquichense]ELZ38861.1 multi-sensor signal transduction histidine kinase [Halorubrum tebenquichense DSM 14210]
MTDQNATTDRAGNEIPPTAAHSDGGDITVLHVDDDESLVEMAATFVERQNDAITVVTATSPAAALDILKERSVDCVVSDYNMPETDGLGLLRILRDEYPDLPFILYTGRGSEEIASDAISAGVTDYLQKETGVDQYAVLANRIANAVAQHRAERAVAATRDRFRKLIEESTDVISIVDANGRWQYLSPSAERVLGYDPDELVGDVGFDYVHPDDRPAAVEKFSETVEHPDRVSAAEFRFDHPDGWVWLENYARNMVDDATIGGFVVHTREVTERVRREQELERQNERLEAVIDTISNDLRGPLRTADANLELVRNAVDEAAVDDAAVDETRAALDRMDGLIDDLLSFAQEGEGVDDLRPVDVKAAATAAWRTVETGAASFTCEPSAAVLADRSRLERLFENLFRNVARHGGPDATVSAGTTDEGFYVADDGVGVAVDEVDRIFESGYSTASQETGFGLSIVRQIAQVHGWTVTAFEDRAGGVRVEFTGVEFA